MGVGGHLFWIPGPKNEPDFGQFRRKSLKKSRYMQSHILIDFQWIDYSQLRNTFMNQIVINI